MLLPSPTPTVATSCRPLTAVITVCRLIAGFALIAVGGCIRFPPSTVISYRTGGSLPVLRTISQPGDYALYYRDDPEPQIPIHLNAGDSIGFIKKPDGRVQAVAGDFRMNISSTAGAAYWKRMPDRGM